MEIPPKEDVESFWRNIWGKQTMHNDQAPWLTTLRSEYCQDVIQKEYIINSNVLDNMINKLQNGKAPGKDMIVGYWYKYLQFYKNNLIELYQKTFNGEIELPSWLTKAVTQLLPKNHEIKSQKITAL